MSLTTTLNDLLRISRTHPVTRGDQIGWLRRFATWQLASRLHRGKLVAPFVHPTRLVVARGQTGLTGNIYFGLADMHEMAFLLHYLRANDLFVDVGANMGSYTVLAAGVCGARCIAFEPVEAMVVELKEQLRLNDIIDRVDIRAIALGAQPGTVRFLDASDNDTVGRVAAHGETATTSRDAPQSTLDIELASVAPALIKMDVEGYEYAVLEGARHVLANPSLDALIMEVNDGVRTYGVDRRTLEVLVRDAGFEPYAYDPTRRALTNVDFAYSNGISDNVLMIRNIEAVRQRVATAPSFSVLGVSF
jgi:FkbM family methyltransferase